MARLLHYGRYPNNLRPIVLDRLDAELKLYENALHLRAYRQELLASNIANADTPNYKARDIDFKTALENTLAGRSGGGVSLARTSRGHLPGEPTDPSAGALKYRSEYQSSVDGNTVNMDVERAAFAENSLHVEALLTFLRGNFKTLQTAITSQ